MNANPLVVSLERFEGPLDLLLFFIKRDEIDIYDIPIARITEEFLEYTRAIQMLSLEKAGEFIVMAAELMRIKAKMLLPKDERPQEEGEEEDPRTELVRRLLEYKQYKEVAESLKEREEEYRNLRYRQFFKGDEKILEEPTVEEILSNVTLFRLLEAYKKAFDRAPKRENMVIEQITWTVEEQAEFVLGELGKRFQVGMMELFEGKGRMWITVTFLALLELIKNRRVAFHHGEEDDDVVFFEV
ncbi:MAG: segregation/condensation protein A [Ignavibacteriae bacterium]|nr:segregation/condensation protein A [Ignavibacteriota bacterium]MCB9217581.1 segregation/condensation protein A [Ignavibacteria bacterium]